MAPRALTSKQVWLCLHPGSSVGVRHTARSIGLSIHHCEDTSHTDSGGRVMGSDSCTEFIISGSDDIELLSLLITGHQKVQCSLGVAHPVTSQLPSKQESITRCLPMCNFWVDF